MATLCPSWLICKQTSNFRINDRSDTVTSATMGRQSEKNDLKKTHAVSYTLGTFSVDINYIVIN